MSINEEVAQSAQAAVKRHHLTKLYNRPPPCKLRTWSITAHVRARMGRKQRKRARRRQEGGRQGCALPAPRPAQHIQSCRCPCCAAPVLSTAPLLTHSRQVGADARWAHRRVDGAAAASGPN